ncbi:MAG TPA: hypothetical protein VMM18_01055 [Gemmatimonadaceae bacterium]|nr:hypothetical protein [Gemmatimonadaceae bacterium]
MSTHCPSPAQLLVAAVAADEPANELVARHIRGCASCRRNVAELRELLAVVRSSPSEQPPETPCLDEVDIARLIDGSSAEPDGAVLRHLASCAQCRAQLAASARVLEDPLVAAEVQRLAPPRMTRRSRFTLVGGLAAATIAGILLWPDAGLEHEGVVAFDSAAYRERTLTTTAAPRILGPVGAATMADSLRWSSVPGADLYRITFWRSDGTVAWAGEARDTVLPLPNNLTGAGSDVLLWEVKARTGWDRWVSSDLVEFTADRAAGRAR